MPNGLPKTVLPNYLTETRWGRCAILKQESNPDIKSVQWYWDKDVRIAIAPGISCFIANKEYEHGGLSPQECIVPILVVKSLELRKSIKIDTVIWVGLVCRVITSEFDPDIKIDIRTKASDSKTSLTEPKSINADGNTPLFIADDSKEGVAAMVVLLDKNGNPVSYVQTVIGGQ
jgi:hypothetical protein